VLLKYTGQDGFRWVGLFVGQDGESGRAGRFHRSGQRNSGGLGRLLRKGLRLAPVGELRTGVGGNRADLQLGVLASSSKKSPRGSHDLWRSQSPGVCPEGQKGPVLPSGM
jgi:hypothetical protein